MNGYSYMAMTNYPYPTKFLQPMPKNPVDASCQLFKDVPAPTSNDIEPDSAQSYFLKMQKTSRQLSASNGLTDR